MKMVEILEVAEPSIYDIHSVNIEAVQVFVDEYIDHMAANRDPNVFISNAVHDALLGLQRQLSTIQVSAIERETGA
jgi:hypothetical protein